MSEDFPLQHGPPKGTCTPQVVAENYNLNPLRNYATHRTFSSFTVKVLRRSSFHLLPTFLQISIGPSGYRAEMHQHHVQGRISMNPAIPWDLIGFHWIACMIRRGPQGGYWRLATSLHARGSSSHIMSSFLFLPYFAGRKHDAKGCGWKNQCTLDLERGTRQLPNLPCRKILLIEEIRLTTWDV